MVSTAAQGGWARVVVAFQPHRYSRTEDLWRDFADSFVGADVVVVTDVDGAGEQPRPGVTGRLVSDAARTAHPELDVRDVGDREALLDLLVDELQPGRPLPDARGRRHHPGARRAPRPAGRPGTPVSERTGQQSATAAVEAAASRLGAAARRDAPLGPLTTYRVGGPAALLVEVDDVAGLAAVAGAVAAGDLPTLVVGRGSNLLVADEGFPGIAVVLGPAFAGVEVDGTTVRAGGAASLPVVARRTAAAGLTGFEWAVGRAGLDRWSGADERRGPRLRHGRDAAHHPRRRPRERRGWCGARDPGCHGPGPRLPPVRRAGHAGRGRGRARPGPGRCRAGRGRDRGDRAVAAGEPARRHQRGVGVHQPRGRLRRPADRRRRGQGPAHRHGVGLRQARQLHPGRRGRERRRRPGPDAARSRTGSRPPRASASTPRPVSWASPGRGTDRDDQDPRPAPSGRARAEPAARRTQHPPAHPRPAGRGGAHRRSPTPAPTQRPAGRGLRGGVGPGGAPQPALRRRSGAGRRRGPHRRGRGRGGIGDPHRRSAGGRRPGRRRVRPRRAAVGRRGPGLPAVARHGPRRAHRAHPAGHAGPRRGVGRRRRLRPRARGGARGAGPARARGSGRGRPRCPPRPRPTGPSCAP